MTEQQPIYPKHDDRDDDDGLHWPRITGITLAITVHVAALLLLLAPVAPPGGATAEDDSTRAVNIEAAPHTRPPPARPPHPHLTHVIQEHITCAPTHHTTTTQPHRQDAVYENERP